MKIIKITTLTILIAGAAQADYSAKIPLESTAGGSLPNGSIKFTNQTGWIAIAPIYTEWVNYGSIFNCNNWTPALNTVESGETFTQTATDCQQQQTRTRQDREQDRTTLDIRDAGAPVQESQTIAATDTRESIGIKNNPWELFADARGLHKGDWSSLSWGGRNLSEIPTEPYPVSNVNSIRLAFNSLITNIEGLSSIQSIKWDLDISNTSISNVNGLRNLISAGSLNLSNNNLTDIEGLSGLTTIESITLQRNQLTNVDGLRNLTDITNGYLTLGNNNLSNINGLINIKVSGGYISIDNTYSGPKLPANSRFCTLNDASMFNSGDATKSQLCE